MVQSKWLVGALVLAVGLVGVDAFAGDGKHSHAHGDGGALPAPTLNAGKKWQTDAPLREGMQSVRDRVQAAVPGVHDGSFTQEKYGALADAIDQDLKTLMARCKLPPEVDAQAHLMLAQLFAGTATMREAGQGMSGVVKVLRGLDSYAKHFQHPGWKPVKH